MAGKRTKLYAGNWKMYKGVADARAFLVKFLELFPERGGDRKSEYAILAQSPLLSVLQDYMSKDGGTIASDLGLHFGWGPQSIHWETEGAFTGELSPKLALELGAKYALSGHSERRQFFGETDESAARRALAAQKHGMRAIFCVGESLPEREKGLVFEVLTRQCEALTKLSPSAPKGFVVAYEPVWAIGTGKVATAAQAEEAHAFVRGFFANAWGDSAADMLQILYGGSVKPQNSAELLACPNIDGVLVGGASLDPASFFEIAANAEKC